MEAGASLAGAAEAGASDGAGPAETVPQLDGQVVSVPAFMAAVAASSLDWMSGVMRAALAPCAGDTPTPSLLASKCTSPPVADPPPMAWMAWLTALSRCFSAEVTMQP